MSKYVVIFFIVLVFILIVNDKIKENGGITNTLNKLSAKTSENSEKEVDKGNEANENIKFRGKLLTPEEYAVEKKRFPARELRRKIEQLVIISNDKGEIEGGIRITHMTISITKGDDVEYPYEITINAPSTTQYMFNKPPIYKYFVSENLDLSSRYVVNGYSYSQVSEFFMKSLEIVLSRLKNPDDAWWNDEFDTGHWAL